MKIMLTHLQFIVLFGAMLLVTHPKPEMAKKINNSYTENNKQQSQTNDSGAELLHSEMLFRY